jgi:hypothetical protein
MPAAPAGPDEPTTFLVGDPGVDGNAPTLPPGSEQLPAADEPPGAPIAATPAAITSPLPSGDWTIALDPAAPDGWSPPRHPVPRRPLAGVGAAPPGSPDDADLPPRPGEIQAVEPKVQIDPTLIEPVHAAHAAATASSYAPPHAPPAIHGGPPPGYPLESPYPMMPGAMPHGLVAPDSSGFGAVRYPPMPSQVRRRHLIIMLATALVAVLLGIAAMLLFRRPPAPVSPGSPGDERSGASEPPVPGESPRAPAGAPADDHGAPPAPSAPPGAAPPGAAPATPSGSGATDPTHAAAPSPPTGGCYAEVSSVPAGADILLDQASVIGTTPQRVALPCGHPVELLVRKPHMVPVTHTITPTPEGASVQFVLARQTFLVKVSSTPPGAAVTLGTKSLGVTPTMVKVPAFESSTLSIAKDGYETETETVAPRGNGTAVHTVLKKAEHKKPR